MADYFMKVKRECYKKRDVANSVKCYSKIMEGAEKHLLGLVTLRQTATLTSLTGALQDVTPDWSSLMSTWKKRKWRQQTHKVLPRNLAKTRKGETWGWDKR